MSRATTDEIFSSYNTTYQGRVHRQHHVPFGGAAGHIYFVRHRPTNQQLAKISQGSRNAEVASYRINDAFILTIGNTGVASGTLIVPAASARSAGVEEVEWIAHTHPLEQESDYESVAQGATETDRTALRIMNGRWGQTSSVVVVCRRGRVVRTEEFRVGE